ncbi:MAG: glycosyltransferase [Candidatus Micrarchaeota archaeon]
MAKISWLIAAYNEENRLPETVRELLEEFKGMDLEVILSDDGSADRTFEVAKKLSKENKNVFTVTAPHAGRGSALRNGIKNARGNAVVLSSADLLMSKNELKKYVGMLKTNEMVLLSKNLPGSSAASRTPLRDFLSRAFNTIVRICGGVSFRDTQGLKVARADALGKILPECDNNGFLFDTQLAIYGNRAGMRVVELPWRFEDMRGGSVNWRSVLKMFIDLFVVMLAFRTGVKI